MPSVSTWTAQVSEQLESDVGPTTHQVPFSSPLGVENSTPGVSFDFHNLGESQVRLYLPIPERPNSHSLQLHSPTLCQELGHSLDQTPTRLPTPEMRRARYPHHFQPIASPFSRQGQALTLTLVLILASSIRIRVLMSLLILALARRIAPHGQLPQRLDPLVVRRDARKVIRVALAQQYPRPRLAHEVL